VDNARFAAQAAALRGQRAELRRRWGIAEGAFCILFCGKFIPKKRPADVVAAATRILMESSEPRPIHLLFVGSGELGAGLRSGCEVVFDADGAAPSGPHASGSDFRPKASFAGFLNQVEISRAYVAADVLVLPSDHGETWGLVVNEAMASGLPCVVSDGVGCGEDLVGPVDPARRCPLGDVGALAAALNKVMRGNDRTAVLAETSARHDFSVTIATLVSIGGRVKSPLIDVALGYVR
jgi:glycosyltransferase involved in cell wall biosynthesis